jgi:hypothetical protein
MASFVAQLSPTHAEVAMKFALQVLEVMIGDGWVKAKYDPSKPSLQVSSPVEGGIIHKHRQ